MKKQINNIFSSFMALMMLSSLLSGCSKVVAPSDNISKENTTVTGACIDHETNSGSCSNSGSCQHSGSGEHKNGNGGCGKHKNEYFKVSNIENKITKESIDNVKKLFVDNKCIACGKCIQIAPKSFDMGENNKAKAISQDNLDSTEVKNAIASCPVGAIGLN